MLQRFKNAVSLPLVLFFIAWMLLHAAQSSQAAFHAMQLAAQTLIPAVFPFCVLSAFLLERDVPSRWKRPLAPLMTRVFGLDGACGAAWVLGVLCGYPIGAFVLTQLYLQREISRESAERALGFCNNAGPGFLFAEEAGLLLLLVQFFAAQLTGLFFRGMPSVFSQRSAKKQPTSLPAALTNAVSCAAQTALQISGLLVFFSITSSLLLPLLKPILPPSALAVFSGLLEVTSGLHAVAMLPISLQKKFVLFSALLGWSGFCVHAQVLSIVLPHGLRTQLYWKEKLLQSALCTVFSMLLCRLFPNTEVALACSAAPTPGQFFFLLFWALGSVFLFAIFALPFYNRRKKP